MAEETYVAPTDPAELDAEIAATEAKLKALVEAKAVKAVEAYPKWVYKLMEEPTKENPYPACEKKLVQSEAEYEALGEGWSDSPDPNYKKDA